jgi:hypothetical protein
VAEIREQALLLEAQALRQELGGCKNNLEKAEAEVPSTCHALSMTRMHIQCTECIC